MYQRQVMDSEDALAAVDAVLALAIAEGAEGIAVAVVDDDGDLVAYARMDGAPAFHRKQAVRKAYTASRVGRGLGEFAAHCAGRGLRVGEFRGRVGGGDARRRSGSGSRVRGRARRGRRAGDGRRAGRAPGTGRARGVGVFDRAMRTRKTLGLAESRAALAEMLHRADERGGRPVASR